MVCNNMLMQLSSQWIGKVTVRTAKACGRLPLRSGPQHSTLRMKERATSAAIAGTSATPSSCCILACARLYRRAMRWSSRNPRNLSV